MKEINGDGVQGPNNKSTTMAKNNNDKSMRSRKKSCTRAPPAKKPSPEKRISPRKRPSPEKPEKVRLTSRSKSPVKGVRPITSKQKTKIKEDMKEQILKHKKENKIKIKEMTMEEL